MHSYDVLGFTYDADSHCIPCAVKRFGDGGSPDILPSGVEDSEGNEPYPIFVDSEWFDVSSDLCETLHCGTCGDLIDVAHNPDCDNAVISDRFDVSCFKVHCKNCDKPICGSLAGQMGSLKVYVWAHDAEGDIYCHTGNLDKATPEYDWVSLEA